MSEQTALPTRRERLLVSAFLELMSGTFLAPGSTYLLDGNYSAAAAPYLIGVILFLVGIFWSRIAKRIGTGRFAHSLLNVASDFKWWMLLLGIILFFISPSIEPRIQTEIRSWSLFHHELQAIPTSLRIQFNAPGKDPVQMGANNIKSWKSLTVDAATKVTSPPVPFLSESPSSQIGQLAPVVIPGAPPTSTYFPQRNWIIFIFFAKATSYGQISIDSHGADIPEWDVSDLTPEWVILWFHGDVTNVTLDITTAK